jgi:hypothetical protein
MKTALQQLINRTSEREADRAVREAMARSLKAGNEVGYPALDPTVPFLRVLRPSNERWDPLVDYRLEGAVKRRLDLKVENQDLLLLPLIYSSHGKAKLRSIPRHRLTPDRLAQRLAVRDSSKDDPKLRGEVNGKIIVVIGHIIGEGPEQTFEIQHGDGQTSHLRVSQLDDARLGARFLLLGCETAQSSAIGTGAKINDLDAIAAFQRALAKTDLATWKDLLSIISGPDMPVNIDPSRIDETDRNVVVDEDGTAYTRAHPEIDVLSALHRLCMGTTLDWMGGAAHASRETASPFQTVPETDTGGLAEYTDCPFLGLRLAYPQTGRVTEPAEPQH